MSSVPQAPSVRKPRKPLTIEQKAKHAAAQRAYRARRKAALAAAFVPVEYVAPPVSPPRMSWDAVCESRQTAAARLAECWPKLPLSPVGRGLVKGVWVGVNPPATSFRRRLAEVLAGWAATALAVLGVVR